MAKHLKHPTKLSPAETCNSLLQKELVLLTIFSQKLLQKEVILHLNSPIFIQKSKTFGLPPKWLLGFPNLSIPKFCLVEVLIIYTIYYILNHNLIEHYMKRGPLGDLWTFSMPGPLLLCLKNWRVQENGYLSHT